jgi:hypothetical protein
MTAMLPTDKFELTQEHADAINALLPNCKYAVGIRENATGDVRFCPETMEWPETGLWWYSQGNMGCDCNRELDFRRQTEPDFDEDTECGHTRYTIVGIWFPDGGAIRDLHELNDYRAFHNAEN